MAHLGKWLRRGCPLKYFNFLAIVAILFSGAERFNKFDSGHYKEHFDDSKLNLDQWLRRRCRLKIFQFFSYCVGHTFTDLTPD